MMDAYTWIVRYRDGRTHGQINDQGVDDGSWASVDADNVELIQIEPGDPKLPVHGVMVPEGAKAFLTFRRVLELDMTKGEQIKHPSLVIIGWTRGTEESYLFVDAEGNGVLAGDRNALPR